ncbi:hypothetical protein [Leptolyngbya sp. KIOST-1]|uniref:hypothetical protein n=1 Tax=Leptolyngbya sp. KIOST-1 TaxID=1229172 RepID=UPI0012E052E0|nr:hypothetical protein [Leptolyngbya sp. KIOST-1]
MKAQQTFSYSAHLTGYFDNQSSHENLLVQVPVRGTAETQVQSPTPDSGPGGLFTALGLSAFALAFLMIRRLQKSEKARNGLGSMPNFRYSTPCSKCRFFNKNPYIKCTVHPKIASKIDAKDCLDFWPVDQDEFHKKW